MQLRPSQWRYGPPSGKIPAAGGTEKAVRPWCDLLVSVLGSSRRTCLENVCGPDVLGGEVDQRPHFAWQDAAFQIDGIQG